MAANRSAPSASSGGTRGMNGGSRRSGRGNEGDRHQRRQPQGRRRLVDVLVVDLQLLLQQLADAIGDAGVHLQPHAGPEAPPPHLAVDDRQQVLALLLDLQVHVPRDPEGKAAERLHAREQVLQVGGDELLERQELVDGVGGRAAVRRRRRPAPPAERTGAGSRGPSPGRTCAPWSSGSRASTASDSDRLEMNGNGWPGSTASGVSTGNTARR